MFQRIRDLREDRDLTQKQVATVLNCSQQVYSNYELGQRDLPTAVLGYGIKGIRSRVALTQLVANG